MFELAEIGECRGQFFSTYSRGQSSLYILVHRTFQMVLKIELSLKNALDIKCFMYISVLKGPLLNVLKTMKFMETSLNIAQVLCLW